MRYIRELILAEYIILPTFIRRGLVNCIGALLDYERPDDKHMDVWFGVILRKCYDKEAIKLAVEHHELEVKCAERA